MSLAMTIFFILVMMVCNLGIAWFCFQLASMEEAPLYAKIAPGTAFLVNAIVLAFNFWLLLNIIAGAING